MAPSWNEDLWPRTTGTAIQVLAINVLPLPGEYAYTRRKKRKKKKAAQFKERKALLRSGRDDVIESAWIHSGMRIGRQVFAFVGLNLYNSKHEGPFRCSPGDCRSSRKRKPSNTTRIFVLLFFCALPRALLESYE